MGVQARTVRLGVEAGDPRTVRAGQSREEAPGILVVTSGVGGGDVALLGIMGRDPKTGEVRTVYVPEDGVAPADAGGRCKPVILRRIGSSTLFRRLRRVLRGWLGIGLALRVGTLAMAAMTAALAGAAVSVAAPDASTVSFAAKLTAKAEVPPQMSKNPGASGSLTGEIVDGRLRWTLKFSGLTGLASAAIHVGAKGNVGVAVVHLCHACFQPLNGTSTLPRTFLKDLKANSLYVSIDTKRNPAGEIRGQLSEV
ncbi:MAG TPA: CHRD domain-containing protein [Gaiellaceae bacterium]|nr:CHRD domain-containing protein [Gaiellaceae bacterium]